MPAASARLIRTGMSIEGMFAWKVPVAGGIAGPDLTKPDPIRDDPILWLVSVDILMPVHYVHLR
ncbi:MAG: hypothetical protein WCF79_17480 [Rhodomicrobium sp.]